MILMHYNGMSAAIHRRLLDVAVFAAKGKIGFLIMNCYTWFSSSKLWNYCIGTQRFRMIFSYPFS